MNMYDDSADIQCLNQIEDIISKIEKMKDIKCDHGNESFVDDLNLFSYKLNEFKNNYEKMNSTNSHLILSKINFAEKIIMDIEKESEFTDSSDIDTIERHEIELPSSNLLLLNNNDIIDNNNIDQTHFYHDYIHSIVIAVAICIILVILWNLA